MLLPRSAFFVRSRLFGAGSLVAGVLMLTLMGVGPVFSQVPQVLHYQGTLAEDDRPAQGPIDVEVAFYDEESGGTALANWQESYSDVALHAGRFDLLIGSQEPLPSALFEATDLYLELIVGGETLPRIPVASTVFALRAGVAEAVADGSVTDSSLAPGAVAGPALAEEAVGTNALASEAVTTRTLANGAVTEAKLAERAVGTSRIEDGAVTSSKLGSSSVDVDALANGAVTAPKVANGAVTRAKIASGQVLTSLNDLSDSVRLIEGDDITITSNADDGTIRISSNGSPWQISSRRWKSDIRPLEDALALVQQLRGVRYRWTESGNVDLGLIAEEVGEVVPEVVTYADNGVDAKSVNYARLVAVLVEAIKTQQAEMEADRALLRRLQSRVTALEERHETP